MYDFDSLRQKGVCTPQQLYTWGFSFVLLFAFLLVSFVVWMSVYIVWVHVELEAKQTDRAMVFGSLRTALEVGAVLRDNIGDDAQEMKNEGLERAAREGRLGIKGSSESHLVTSLKKEKHLTARKAFNGG